MATGLVIRDLPSVYSNWRATQSLPEFMRRHKLVGIAGPRHPPADAPAAREGRAERCCILAVAKGGKPDKTLALKAARAFPASRAWTSPRS